LTGGGEKTARDREINKRKSRKEAVTHKKGRGNTL